MNKEQITQAAEDFISIYWNTEHDEPKEMLSKFPIKYQAEIIQKVKEIDLHTYNNNSNYFKPILQDFNEADLHNY